MENIMVSIIIPTYKQDILLKRAISSVIDQTHKNIEIIIVDDNDKKEDICKVQKIIRETNFKKITYLKNKKNLGSVESRNNGIDKATGDYITFLDDDDYYDKEKIEKQLQDMLNLKADFSVTNIALVKKGKTLENRKRKFMKKNEPILTKHLKYHITGTSTFMFKKKYLNDIGGFSKYDLGDEFYLMEKAILSQGKFIHVNFTGVFAETDKNRGLSSWTKRIEMENLLFNEKKKYFHILNNKDIKYIKMRYYAVLANSYKNGGKIIFFLKNLILSFYWSPMGFIRILLGYDK